MPRRSNHSATPRHRQEGAYLLRGQMPRPARGEYELNMWMSCQQRGQSVRPHEQLTVPDERRAVVTHHHLRGMQHAVVVEEQDQMTPARTSWSDCPPLRSSQRAYIPKAFGPSKSQSLLSPTKSASAGAQRSSAHASRYIVWCGLVTPTSYDRT